MNLVVAVSFIVSSLIMMLLLSLKNTRHKELSNHKSKFSFWALLVFVLTLSSDLIDHRSLYPHTLLLDTMLTLCPVMLLSSSVWNHKGCVRGIAVFWFLNSVLLLYYVLDAFSLVTPLPPSFFVYSSVFCVLALCLLIIYGIWNLLRNVKVILRWGGVWQIVSLNVDTVYLMSVILIVSSALGTAGLNRTGDVYVLVSAVFAWLTLLALLFRVLCDNTMVFSHRMERRIIESLKVSVVGVPNEVTKTDTAYQEIYDRIVAHFEVDKPYLRSDLIIDDLVKVVFSNKLYISRAISQITGRNFCQFVNYYRIMYSVETFRRNPELKVTELAGLSGFNSLVSFSMAFRLYMNENPSDWIRKERNRRAKRGQMD